MEPLKRKWESLTKFLEQDLKLRENIVSFNGHTIVTYNAVYTMIYSVVYRFEKKNKKKFIRGNNKSRKS